jgi:hypothetical protein
MYVTFGDAPCMLKDCQEPWAVERLVSGTGYVCLCWTHDDALASRWEVPAPIMRQDSRRTGGAPDPPR